MAEWTPQKARRGSSSAASPLKPNAACAIAPVGVAVRPTKCDGPSASTATSGGSEAAARERTLREELENSDADVHALTFAFEDQQKIAADRLEDLKFRDQRLSEFGGEEWRSNIRRKGETAEEKKARKAAVKLGRREARAAKKGLKTTFKQEQAEMSKKRPTGDVRQGLSVRVID